MENRINQVITTENGDKFLILHQAIYNNTNYYVCCAVEKDESDVKELLKYYNNTKKAMKGIGRRGMGGGAMNRIMGQFMK